MDSTSIDALDYGVGAPANSYTPEIVEQDFSRAEGRLPVEDVTVKAQIVRISQEVPVESKYRDDNPEHEEYPDGRRFIGGCQVGDGEHDSQPKESCHEKDEDAVQRPQAIDRHLNITVKLPRRCARGVCGL